MYNDLYEKWKKELENVELEALPPGFYGNIADYLKHLREEGRMIDRRTVKALLLRCEMRNAKRMLRELVQARYKKLAKKVVGGEKVPSEFLTNEEEKLCTGCLPILEAYQSFAKNLLRGLVSNVDIVSQHKSNALRFLKDVPEIIGADLQTYGPYKAEDIASLPVENAQIFVKQGLAEKIEVSYGMLGAVLEGSP
jgi:DNA replication factor GINS